MISKLSYIFSTKDKIKILLLMVMIVIGSAIELGAVAIFSPFIDLTLGNVKKEDNIVLSILSKLVPTDNEMQFLTVVAVCIIVLYIVKNVYTIVEKNIIYKFSYRIERTISTRLLKSYMAEPYTFHLNKNISVLQRSLIEDIDQFTKGLLHLMEVIAELLVCIVLAIYLFTVSKSITLSVVGLLLVCVFFFIMFSKHFSFKWGQEAQGFKAGVYQSMNEALGGIKEIKVLNCESDFVERYDAYLGDYVRVTRLGRLIGIVPKYFIEMVSMTGLMLAVIFKMHFGQKEFEEFVPQLAVFAVAAFRLLPSVGRINEHISTINYSIPSVNLVYNDIKEIESMEKFIKSGEKASTKVDLVSEKSWRFKNELKVSNLTYSYPNTETSVVEDAEFEIMCGDTVAIIGASGAGKTTVIDVLLGLLTPQRGLIMADNMNVLKNLSTWQRSIGYIPQVIYLSDDSIRNNVAFGIPRDQINDEQVMNAIKQAQLDELVLSLPDGLDTMVGDRGVRISGGQRQRIGIARALYHNPDILVLDEATSALDNDTESAVMESIDALKGTKTIIIIAHRLTTIRNADKVYEVVNGKVIRRNKDEVVG